MHQSTTTSLTLTIWPRRASRKFLTLHIVQTLLPETFGYSLNSEVVVMRQLRRWKRLWRRSLTRSHKRTSMGPSRGCWNSTSAFQRRRLLRRGLEFHECTINKSAHTKKVWKLIVCTLYIYIYIYIYIYCHPLIDCFVVSQFFNVARHGKCFKLGSQPGWLYASRISKGKLSKILMTRVIGGLLI